MARTIGVILAMRDQFTGPARRATSNTRNLNREIRRTQNQMRNMARHARDCFGKVVKYSGVAIAAGVGLFAKKSIDLASDLQEVQNVVDTTFKESSGEINKWSRNTLRNYGITTLEAKKYSSTLGAIMKSSGIGGYELNKMSMDLSGLSGDMASFYNLKPDVAFDKLRSAIAGETEPMKALGVNMNVANMEAFAMSKGINKAWKEMDQAQQTTLRYQYLMDKTKDAQGDFAKTNKSWANQIKIAKATTEQMGATLATNFLPLLNDGLIKVNDWISGINNYVEENKDKFKEMAEQAREALEPVKETALYIKENWGTIAPIIMTIVGAIAAYKLAMLAQLIYTKAVAFAEFVKNGVLATGATVVNANTIAQWAWNAAMKASPIGMVIGAITALIVVGILVYRNWDKIKAKTLALWKVFGDKFPAIKKLVEFVFGKIRTVAVDAAGNLKKSFGMAIEGVIQLFQLLWTIIKEILGGLLGYIKSQFDNILGFIDNVLAGNFMEAGKNLVDYFLQPFYSIYDTVKGIIGKVKGAFGDSVEVNVKETVTEKTVKGTRKAARFATGMREYAKGGIATRASIFGEAGPEIAIPLKKNNQRSLSLLDYANKFFSSNKAGHASDGTNDISNITSNRNDKTTVSKVDSKTSSKTENNFNFYGDVYGMDDFKEKVAEVIVRIHKKDKPNTPVVV